MRHETSHPNILHRYLLPSLLLLHLFGFDAQAQWSTAYAPPPSVLHPAPPQWWIGPQLGVNLNQHSGGFFLDFCPDCHFEDGSGTGVTVGFEVGRMLTPSVGIALKLLYNDFRAGYSTLETLLSEFVEEEPVYLDYDRRIDLLLSYVMVHPVVQYYPFPLLHVFAGPAVGFRTIGEQTYTLNLLTPGFEFEVGGGDSRVVEEDSGDIPASNALRVDLRAGVGLNIRLGRNVRFSPEASYGLPVTSISDNHDWKANAIHLNAILKIDL